MTPTRRTLLDSLVSEKTELEAKIERLTLQLQTDNDDDAEERQLKMMQRYYMERYNHQLTKRINKLGDAQALPFLFCPNTDDIKS